MSEQVISLWQTLSPLHSEIIGLGFAILTSLIFYVFRAKVNLIFGRANNSRNVISVPDENIEGEVTTTEIYVEKFYLQNTGRKAATNVEFVLSSFPSDISVWQPRNSQIIAVEKGSCLVNIPQIAPRELVIIDCVYLNQHAAFISSVKCAEALGKEVPFWTVRRFSPFVNSCFIAVFFFGFAFVIQFLLKLILI